MNVREIEMAGLSFQISFNLNAIRLGTDTLDLKCGSESGEETERHRPYGGKCSNDG